MPHTFSRIFDGARALDDFDVVEDDWGPRTINNFSSSPIDNLLLVSSRSEHLKNIKDE